MHESPIEKYEKIDDSTIAIYTKGVEALFPYNLAYWMVISKCALEAAGNDYKVYAKSPSGTGRWNAALANASSSASEGSRSAANWSSVTKSRP